MDDDPAVREEPVPRRTLDAAGLGSQVREELVRLLTTRCPKPADAVLGRSRTVLDYGLPDLEGGRETERPTARRLARLVRETIVAFEPRLHAVDVTVVDTQHGRVTARIQGALATESLRMPVRFDIDLGNVGDLADGD